MEQQQADAQGRWTVPGLQNLGNTCFFNAILQALASVRCFQDFLNEVVRQAGPRNARAIPFTSALRDCLHGKLAVVALC